jgi:phosphatidylglycerophosphate synthase
LTSIDRFALGLVALCLLSMVVFALSRSSREHDPEVARRRRTVLLGFWVRDWVMWALGPFERAMVGARVSPLVFNVAGVVMGVVAGVAYARGSLSLGGWMVLLGGLCDILDGRIARARGMVSRSGAFIDSTLDRFAETFAFMGLALYFAGSPAKTLATLGALGGSLLVSYARARGEAHGVSQSGGLMQRAERLVILALASLLDSPLAAGLGWAPGTLLAGAIAVIAVGSIGTAIYRTVAIARILAGSDRS